MAMAMASGGGKRERGARQGGVPLRCCASRRYDAVRKKSAIGVLDGVFLVWDGLCPRLPLRAPRVCLELCGLAMRGGREEARCVRARARSHAATGRCTFALCAMICTVQADGHREHLDEATRRDGAPCLVVDTFLLYY